MKNASAPPPTDLFTRNGDAVWPPRAEQGSKTGVKGSRSNKIPKTRKKNGAQTSVGATLPDLVSTSALSAPAVSSNCRASDTSAIASRSASAPLIPIEHPFAFGEVRVMPPYALDVEPHPLIAYHGISNGGNYQFYVGPAVELAILTHNDVSFE